MCKNKTNKISKKLLCLMILGCLIVFCGLVSLLTAVMTIWNKTGFSISFLFITTLFLGTSYVLYLMCETLIWLNRKDKK